jgi:hypothetical protein
MERQNYFTTVVSTAVLSVVLLHEELLVHDAKRAQKIIEIKNSFFIV